MGIQEALNKYLDWKGTAIKPSSVETYRLHLLKFVEFFSKPFEELTEDDLDIFKAAIRQRYPNEAHYAQIIITLKDFITFSFKRKFTTVDPYFIRVPKYRTRPHLTVSFEEYSKMCDTLSDNDFSDLQKKVALRLLWWGGLRNSELCKLDTLQIDTQKWETIIRAAKSYKLRLIKWDEETNLLLCKYIGIRICMNQHPALFVASNGQVRERITCRTLQRWIKEVCKRAGITRKLSPHSFRHGLIHYLYGMGLDQKTIQDYVGHTDPDSTIKNYMVWDLNEMRDMHEKVRFAMSQKAPQPQIVEKSS